MATDSRDLTPLWRQVRGTPHQAGALDDVGRSAWVRSWCGKRLERLPPVVAADIQRRVVHGATNSFIAQPVSGFAILMVICLVVLPWGSAKANWWLAANAIEYAVIIGAVILLRRRRARDQLTMRLLVLATAPALALSAIILGMLPYVVGDTDTDTFYLSVFFITVFGIGAFFWVFGQWLVSTLYMSLFCSALAASFWLLDRPERWWIVPALLGLVAQLVVVSMPLHRGLITTHYNRFVVFDQQAEIDLLLGDFEQGSRDWIFETDESLVLTYVPEAMALASVGVVAVRVGVDLRTLVPTSTAAGGAGRRGPVPSRRREPGDQFDQCHQ